MSEDRSDATLREAREAYFAENGMAPDGGYDERGVELIGAGCRDRAGLRLELRVLGFALAWSPGAR